MEKLKRIIEEETKLDKKIRNKDYREITKEEYKKYIKFYNETKEKLNKTFFNE